MATATATASTTPQDYTDIWRGQEIEVIGITGEYSSGKTMFAITIAPGKHPPGTEYAGEAKTLMYDNEGSSTSYETAVGFERVDMAREMLEKFPTGNYSPKDRWEWWVNDVKKRAKPGKYLVIGVDPISELVSGLIDWVMANPQKFNCTKAQFERSAGLFWGKVKDHLKGVLDDIRVRCKTFAFVAHMRNEFKGNTPTGRREAKGLETFFELATMYLEMDRKPDRSGKVPEKPAANVLKGRLSHFVMDEDGEIEPRPILPPRLPVATPKAIREYILNPPDYKSLKKGEKFVGHEMSEEEKLYLQAKIAEDTARSSEAQLRAEESRADREKRLQEQQERKQNSPPPQDQSAELATRRREKTNASAIDAMGEGESEAESESESKNEESRGVEVGNGGSATATESPSPNSTSTDTPTEPIQLEDCTVDGIKQYAKNHNITVPQLVAVIEYIGGEGAKLGKLTDDQLTEVCTALHNVVTERRLGGEPIDQTAPWEDQPGTTAKN